MTAGTDRTTRTRTPTRPPHDTPHAARPQHRTRAPTARPAGGAGAPAGPENAPARRATPSQISVLTSESDPLSVSSGPAWIRRVRSGPLAWVNSK